MLARYWLNRSYYKQRYKQTGLFIVNSNKNPSQPGRLWSWRSTKGVIFLNAIWLSIDIDNNSAAVLVDASPIFIVTRCQGLEVSKRKVGDIFVYTGDGEF